MQKIQILFPELVMNRLRKTSQEWDRPVSEIVRKAVDDFLNKLPAPDPHRLKLKIPVFQGGKLRIPAENFKEHIYSNLISVENGHVGKLKN